MSRVMKDSGVEWIGKYPESSRLIRFRYLFSIIGGNGFSDALQGRTSGDYPFYKASDINGDAIYIEYANNYVDEYTVIHNRFNIVPKNSIIISKIGESLKKNHRKISLVNCCIDNNLEAFTQRQKSDVKFTYYLLSLVDMLWFDNGGTVPSLNNSKLKDLYLPDVPLTRQVQIRAYLDTKCKKIDRLISIQEEMIAELQAYKQSVITEAVTKGLDPDVPMKDSGVEWIGKTPIRWNEMRLKNLFISRCGGAWGIEKQDNDGDIVCIRVADFDFSTQTISEGERTIRNYTHDQIERLRLSHGDILIEKSGGGEKTPVGRTILFSGDVECVYSNFIERLRPIKTTNCRYIAYLLKSLYQSSYMCIYINQTTGIQNLDLGSLLNEHIFLPNLQEQNAIVYFLDARCNKIDQLITLKQSKIEMLKEYKKSLIYECVTGKREIV